MARSHMNSVRRREHREALAAAHGYWCQHCLRPFTPELPPTLDHVHPFSLGGLNRRSNLQLLCYPCNHARDQWIHQLPQ